MRKVRDAVLVQAATAIFTPQSTCCGSEAPEPLPEAAAIKMLERFTGK
jgi:hypothetical protein